MVTQTNTHVDQWIELTIFSHRHNTNHAANTVTESKLEEGRQKLSFLQHSLTELQNSIDYKKNLVKKLAADKSAAAKNKKDILVQEIANEEKCHLKNKTEAEKLETLLRDQENTLTLN